MISYASIVSYCLSKKGAREDYPFGPDPLVFKVGSKMFALVFESGGYPHLSLKCDPVLAEILRQQYDAVKPGYHLNKRHWNTVIVDGSIPEEELLEMIDHSYELVYKSLKKSERESLS